MSGDVQPRKRKDKKRKKDEPSVGPVFVKEEPPVLLVGNNGSDELIHVYKESRLGGNICAKVVFFLLLGALAVMVGLIVTEHRGSNEVQTASDSPWSQMLEGWIDDSPPDKHDDEHGETLDSGEHDEEGQEEDSHQENDDEDEHDEEEPAVYEQEQHARTAANVASEMKVSEEDEDEGGAYDDKEEDEEEEEEEEEEDEDQGEQGDEDDEQGDDRGADVEEKEDDNNNDDDDDNNNDDESGETEDIENEELPQSLEKQGEEDEDERDEKEDVSAEEEFIFREIPGVTASAEDMDNDDDFSHGDEDRDEGGDIAGSQSHASFYSTDNDEGENDMEENNIANNDNDDEDTISEERENDYLSSNLRGDQNEEESNDIDELNEGSKNVEDYEEVGADRDSDPLGSHQVLEKNDDSAEQLIESDDDFEEVTDPAGTPEAGEGEEESEGLEPTGVALKFGVGIAIIIVAHVVLVRKWNESDETGATTLQATTGPSAVPRRQTLIPPSIDPSNLIPEPDDFDDYSDEEYDDDEEGEETPRSDKQSLARNYGRISPEASEEEEIEEEEEEEEEDEDVEDEDEDPEQDFDKQYGHKLTYGYNLTSAPTKQDSQEGDEDMEDDSHSNPWKSVGQHQQHSDPEISDGEELSGSDDEPPATLLRRTGGPKDVDVNTEWPIGPDYPADQFSTPSPPKDTLSYNAVEAQLEENPEAVLKQVISLLSTSPKEPVLLSLQAQALDKLAERKHSNKLLEDAIAAYLSLLQLDNVNDDLFLKTADRCINRMRFRGQHSQAIGVNKMLITRFPKDPKHGNDLAVTYLMVGKVLLAKRLLEETLKIWPSNGFALVHYGFILKTSENNNEEGSRLMQAGIDSKEPGTLDARFLFHLGDAYNRLGRHSDAEQVYQLGADKKLFKSKYQRSLYNVDRLTARPWWTLQQTTYEKELRKFEEHWREIRDEGMSILQSQNKANFFKDEAENLRDKGVWKQLELYARGQQSVSNCKKAPVTCQLIARFPAAQGCRRGQAKFSVMQPNTHVWPHCGPTNCRLRAHLGLVVPPGTELRVGEEKRSWQEGKVLVFDDSFEHEVWHNGTSLRLVLIIDFWHPELTEKERRSLPAI